MTRPLLLALALTLGSCAGSSSDGPVQAQADTPFRLALGEAAAVDGHTVRFVGVVEDSRCPQGVQCVTAGVARVRVAVGGAQGVLQVRHADAGGGAVAIGPLAVRAQQLTPYPGSPEAGAAPEVVLVASGG